MSDHFLFKKWSKAQDERDEQERHIAHHADMKSSGFLAEIAHAATHHERIGAHHANPRHPDFKPRGR